MRILLARMGFDKYFETIIISCEVGFPKPSLVIFEQAAKQLSLPPGSVLHVGDSLYMDVIGAKSAGFQALKVDRDKPSPHGQTSSLATLPAMLAVSNTI